MLAEFNEDALVEALEEGGERQAAVEDNADESVQAQNEDSVDMSDGTGGADDLQDKEEAEAAEKLIV